MIRIKTIDELTFEVTVDASITSTHHVTVSEDIYQRLTGGKVSREELVRTSFEFLLEREPNTSILGRFDLPVIGSYFPEYEARMRARFAEA